MKLLLLLSLAAAPLVAAQPTTYVLDTPASTLAYTGSHPAHDWTGTSRQVTGTVRVDPAQPAGAQVEITAPVESFDSGNGSRDSNMLDVVEVEDYPDVRFVSSGLAIETWRATADGYAGRWRVRGQLTFHGQTRAVEIPVDVLVAGTRLEAKAQFPVSLSEFGVRRPRLMFIPVRDEIQMEARLVATRQ